MSWFEVINTFMAIAAVFVVPIALAILWKRGNDFRELYIQARMDYLREKNERLPCGDKDAKKEG